MRWIRRILAGLEIAKQLAEMAEEGIDDLYEWRRRVARKAQQGDLDAAIAKVRGA